MCFFPGNCKSLGLECRNEAVEPPSGLKGYLLGFPTSPSAHNAAPVEAVRWSVGVAGVLEGGSGEQAVSPGRQTHFTSCHAQRGQAPPQLVFPPAAQASLLPLRSAILCPGIHLFTG